jgi:hypothetical protein
MAIRIPPRQRCCARTVPVNHHGSCLHGRRHTRNWHLLLQRPVPSGGTSHPARPWQIGAVAERQLTARDIEPQLLAFLQRSGCRRQPDGELSARLNPPGNAATIFPRLSWLLSDLRLRADRLRFRGSVPGLLQDRI